MDKVVTAVQFRDYVLVITEQGKIFQVWHNETSVISVAILHQLKLEL